MKRKLTHEHQFHSNPRKTIDIEEKYVLRIFFPYIVFNKIVIEIVYKYIRFTKKIPKINFIKNIY